jgi:hypothetical protein
MAVKEQRIRYRLFRRTDGTLGSGVFLLWRKYKKVLDSGVKLVYNDII